MFWLVLSNSLLSFRKLHDFSTGALVGPNGVGKTTLAQLLVGLLKYGMLVRKKDCPIDEGKGQQRQLV